MLTDATLLDEFVLVSLLFTSVGVIEFAVISWLNTNVFYLFVVLCLIVLLIEFFFFFCFFPTVVSSNSIKTKTNNVSHWP